MVESGNVNEKIDTEMKMLDIEIQQQLNSKLSKIAQDEEENKSPKEVSLT